MVKRSYSRSLSIIGIIASFAFSFFILKGAWDFQRALTPTCTEFCSDTARLRNEGVATAVILLFMAVALIYELRAAKKRDQQRQLAAQNSQEVLPLAGELSKSDNTNLILPVTIRTVVKSRNVMQLLGLCWGITSIIVVPLSIFVIRDPTLRYTDYVLLFIFSLSFYVFMTIIALFAVVVIRERMEINEEGISLHSGGRNRQILWSEAKLFARPPLSSNEKTHSQFELASAKTRILWYFRDEDHGFLTGPQPTMPYREYVRVMESLPPLINAKTGLPLYDLRKN